jgi:hypothetical protein
MMAIRRTLPEQAEVVSAVLLPNVPAGQNEHAPLPVLSLYVPAAHATAETSFYVREQIIDE